MQITKKFVTHSLFGVFLLFVALLIAAPAASSQSLIVYDTIPAEYPGSFPSVGYEATSTDELGDHIAFAGTQNVANSVVVGLTNWSCENDFDWIAGAWVPNRDGYAGEACLSTPGSGFVHPITLNIYAVDDSGAEPAVGPLLLSKTESFFIPYRPSWDDVNCTADGETPDTYKPFGGKWYDPVLGVCVTGYAFNITFDLSAENILLPDEVIYGIAYDTNNHGASPLGVAGPYSSLNLSLTTAAPFAGSNVEPDAVFWDTSYAPFYTDGGSAGIDIFRRDSGWGTYTPVVQFIIAEQQPPVVLDLAADPAPVGGSAPFSALVSDVDTGGSNIAGAEYALYDGATFVMSGTLTAIDGAFDSPYEAVAGTLTAPAETGLYNLCVTGSDAAGNVSAAECTVLAVYDPAGGFVTGGGWFTSPAGAYRLDDYNMPQLVWDQGFEAGTDGWLDGDDSWYGSVTQVPSGTDGVASAAGAYHAIMEGDGTSAPFSRFDGYRAAWTGAWTAEIDVYLDPDWAAGTGFDYTVAASGADGNHQRDYIFHVTSDTSSRQLLVAGSNNTNFVPREDLENLNHYVVADAGWYTLQHVFYNDGGALAVDLNLLDSSGTLLFTETRYNAADIIPDEVGGNRYAWFTFINVAGGIAVDDHQLEVPASPAGRASFGFVAKYKKGANVPTGSTEFVFNAVGLNFHSNSYQWLVVNQGGTNAQFKGEGTINGAPAPNGDDYKFMLWAGDGDPDTFRIKIWWDDGGSEVVVYDNGSDQPIGGGNIVIHTKK